MDQPRMVVLVAAALATGLYLAFALAVMSGIVPGGDRAFVEATRRTNRAILNTWFVLAVAARRSSRSSQPCCTSARTSVPCCRGWRRGSC